MPRPNDAESLPVHVRQLLVTAEPVIAGLI
jgi:hypothetical protein